MRRAFLAVILMAVAGAAAAQNPTAASGLRVFLDCDRGCDRSFLRTDISIIDWVNDREVSDVHLLITRENTGGGGQNYTLNFIGRRWFSSMADTLQFASLSIDTDDERRRRLSNAIKMGLVRYLAKTTLANQVSVGMARIEEAQLASIEEDPWDYWSFRISGNGSIRGEEATDGLNLGGDFSANRTTEAWKVRLFVRGNRDESNFSYALDEGVDTTITSIRTESFGFGSLIKSLTNHWSAGLFVGGNISSRRNIDGSASFGPSIEYNIFPYSQSTEREFRLQYHLRLEGTRYNEVTVFDLTSERFLEHSMEARLDLNQPWGDAEFGAEFVHYLTNFEESKTDFYNLRLNARLDVRVARGLSVNLNGSYAFINDQLYLPKRDASEEDILLGRISLETSYEYRFSVGLSYRFGSIYNNVVNPRFGGW